MLPTTHQFTQDALAAVGRRDWPEAARFWQGLLGLEPNNVLALIGAGEALCNAGRLDQAEAVLERGLEARPGEPRMAELHALVAGRRGDWPVACARWAQLRAAFPGYLGGWLFGGEALREAGRLAESEAVLEAGIARFPTSTGSPATTPTSPSCAATGARLPAAGAWCMSGFPRMFTAGWARRARCGSAAISRRPRRSRQRPPNASRITLKPRNCGYPRRCLPRT